MSRNFAYLTCVGLSFILCSSCSRQQKDKNGIDWHVSLDHSKKSPYGASIVFETLPAYFPNARREQLSHWFRYTGVDDYMYGGYDSANLLVLLGLDCYLTNEEWISLLKFAKAGNEIFLLSANLDVHLMRAFRLSKMSKGGEEYEPSLLSDGSYSEKALKLLPDSSTAYGYHGRPISAYFKPYHEFDVEVNDDEASNNTDAYERKTLETSIDTIPKSLGVAHGNTDFLRYKVGKGHITLHAAPLVLSNYFLLQKGNRAYLDSIWHSFPANISVIYWNEYFRRTTQASSINVLLKYPATRWAFIIALCTLLLYVLFGLKRLQRIVPIVPPVENASVSFVETVGRLYFNKGNHANLAEKMSQHFLEWVRTRYYLDTTQLNETFICQLAAKSGRPEEEAAALISRIHDIRLGTPVTPEYLYELHHAIQSFYNAR